MQDLERSQIAELLRENNKLLQEIAKQGRPIKHVEELKELLTPGEMKQVVKYKVESVGIGDIVQVEAEAAGFDSVESYIKHLELQKQRKNHHEVDIAKIAAIHAQRD